MILEHVTTYAFLQIRSAKHRSVVERLNKIEIELNWMGLHKGYLIGQRSVAKCLSAQQERSFQLLCN